MEIEIVTLDVKGNAKLTIPTDRQEQIQVKSRSVALRRVFDLKLRRIHLTEIILKVWVIYGLYVIDVCLVDLGINKYCWGGGEGFAGAVGWNGL